MANYSLQTTASQLVWAARDWHHDDPEKFWSRSTYWLQHVLCVPGLIFTR